MNAIDEIMHIAAEARMIIDLTGNYNMAVDSLDRNYNANIVHLWELPIIGDIINEICENISKDEKA